MYRISYQSQQMSQYRNAFIRSHLDYADAFYGQTYPQKNRIKATQCCISFKLWQLEKSQEKSWQSLQQNSSYGKFS